MRPQGGQDAQIEAAAVNAHSRRRGKGECRPVQMTVCSAASSAAGGSVKVLKCQKC